MRWVPLVVGCGVVLGGAVWFAASEPAPVRVELPEPRPVAVRPPPPAPAPAPVVVAVAPEPAPAPPVAPPPAPVPLVAAPEALGAVAAAMPLAEPQDEAWDEEPTPLAPVPVDAKAMRRGVRARPMLESGEFIRARVERLKLQRVDAAPLTQ